MSLTTGLGCDTVAALCTTRIQNLATALGGHTLPEAVSSVLALNFGLVCSLHSLCSITKNFSSGKINRQNSVWCDNLGL